MPKIKLLEVKARLYADIRAYFNKTGVMEVHTPVLSFSGNTDPQIESFTTMYSGAAEQKLKTMYLHTSPEFFMKRLLSQGSGSIYQLASVFRQAEVGRFHNPEFEMLEWYRVDFNYQELMDDVVSLIYSLSQREISVNKISYEQAFKSILVNPHNCSIEKLNQVANNHGISLQTSEDLDKDQWLALLMTHVIEPSFDKEKLTFIYDFPASQASLAKIRQDKFPIAERFELYWGGVELANGFTELLDEDEQRNRFIHDNELRVQVGLNEVSIDDLFLDALVKGLPACSGVAIGLDRLLMVLAQLDSLKEAMAFDIDSV